MPEVPDGPKKLNCSGTRLGNGDYIQNLSSGKYIKKDNKAESIKNFCPITISLDHTIMTEVMVATAALST